ALTDADRAGRDLVLLWMRDLGLDITIDTIGNVVATRPGHRGGAPVLCGSHIDTVATGGIYDGNYGVLAGLEVIETLIDAGVSTARPLAVAFFTNEEGVRFAPDMMGSLVYAGGLTAEVPHAYVELHIEQGPILERTTTAIGAVTGVQGISWQELTITGQSNHAGTTPMAFRHDAAYAAAAVTTFVRQLAQDIGGHQVATVGQIDLHPILVNVVAARATMTVDLRNTDEGILQSAEARLFSFLDELASEEGVTIDRRTLVRFEPVDFDPRVIDLVERVATDLGDRWR